MLGSWFKNPENSIFLPLRLFLHQSGCFYLLFSDLSALGSSLWGQCGHLMSWCLRPVPSRWCPSSGPCGAKAQGEDPAPIQRGKDAPERMLPSLCGCSQRTSHERKFTKCFKTVTAQQYSTISIHLLLPGFAVANRATVNIHVIVFVYI